MTAEEIRTEINEKRKSFFKKATVVHLMMHFSNFYNNNEDGYLETIEQFYIVYHVDTEKVSMSAIGPMKTRYVFKAECEKEEILKFRNFLKEIFRQVYIQKDNNLELVIIAEVE